MKIPSPTADEVERLASLHRQQLLDAPEELVGSRLLDLVHRVDEAVTADALQRPTERRGVPGLHTVFSSGYSAEIAGREFSLNEGRSFIRKPAPPQHILAVVRRCLDENLHP